MNHRKELVEGLHKEICAINEGLFSAQLRIEYIHRYNQTDRWENISDEMVRELEDNIAPLIKVVDEDELAKRFDLLLYTIELAHLQGQGYAKPRIRVKNTAGKLAKKGNLPQVKQHARLIDEVQRDTFWDEADIFSHERVRVAFRDLIKLIDKEKRQIYYTSFEDEIQSSAEQPGEYDQGEDFKTYREKVNHYLKQHQDDIVVYKLRNNKQLTDSDFMHIEKILWHDLGSKDEYEKTFGEVPLLNLVARLVGMEKTAVETLFSGFISEYALNSQQMEFVTLVIDHVVENGTFDKTLVNSYPFNKHGSITTLFDGKVDVVKKIVSQIDAINDRIAVG